jgi:hypothetical protein
MGKKTELSKPKLAKKGTLKFCQSDDQKAV